MFAKALIANRGAIARRIIRTLRRMNIASVALYSDADIASLHVSDANEAILIGRAPASESYLNVDAILAAAKATGAQAIHPGYGFLSENAAFAEACEHAGIAFVGPTPENIRAFGLKHTARALARKAGVPLAPGTGLLANVGDALAAASDIGFPVILKASAGGGGIGMRVCESADDVRAAFEAVSRLARDNFSDGGVFLERFVRTARHIEVQVFGDGAGRVVALGERDCSLQRRNQKVLEEAPAPRLPPRTRAALIDAALSLTRAARYRNAGTVEFLYDAERDDFFFLEVNTRLQVEHGVTEEVTGVDLVEWMMRGAAGDYEFLDKALSTRGHAIQARIYAEDPGQDFRPSVGVLSQADFPGDARVETWVSAGAEISAFYDPMIAKVIVRADDRAAAVAAMQRALDGARLAGVETNVTWLRDVARSVAFVEGNVSTSALAKIAYVPNALRVLSGGPSSTIQDAPGRRGRWDVGVPPSGPMDALAFRLANRLVGNAASAAGLEFAAMGPTLLFAHDAVACLGGADFGATLDGAPVPPYELFTARAGQTLKIGRVRGAGLRGCLAVRGGIDVPAFLGSKAAFTLGGFGGAFGRTLAAGDVLHLGEEVECEPRVLPRDAQPDLAAAGTLRVMNGPHGAPDFFTDDDIATLSTAEWRVHYNSSRTGVRLIGPKPEWTRRDGGEAGLHPSNIHDNPYAIGAIDFTGDMPIILGPDGPSLGGFVCPFVVISADLWKIGQLAPGDAVRFEVVGSDFAAAERQAQERLIETMRAPKRASSARSPEPAVVREAPASPATPRVVYRRQGDDNILVEYGPLTLDLELRLRVHALMLEVEKLALPAIIDITPGIRSLQIHYDPDASSEQELIDALTQAEEQIGALGDVEIPSRVVWLPLSWDDPAIHDTIDKYVASVRDDAPWTPDNIEFIRRINGLASRDDVNRIVFDARYLVMGLGDVYLGAPVATPLDPRHRLVTTKYNPARTWTPPNVVGIGGAYLCIYGMEGPGGYQLFGRTIQVWNSWRETAEFEPGKPWLLRFFDQIRFFPVTHEELTEWRRDFPLGRRALRIEHETFRLKDYRAFLADNAASIAAFEATRRAAFDAERADWEERGEFARVEALSENETDNVSETVLAPDGCELVESPLGGSIWKVSVNEGERVVRDQVLAVVEAMKTECDISSPFDGVVRAIYVREKQAVAPGAPILALEIAT